MEKINLYLKKIEDKPWVYESLFYVPYFTFIISNLLLITTIPVPSILAPISKLPLLFTIIKILIDIGRNQVSTREKIQWLILIIITIGIRIFGGQNFPIYYLIFTLGLKNISLKKIIKYHALIVGGIVLIVFFLATIGFIENKIIYRSDWETKRYAFGIGYPTDFSGFIFFLYGFYYYLNQKKSIWLNNFIGFGLALFLMFYVDARLDVMLILLLITIVTFDYYRPEYRKYYFYVFPLILMIFWLSFLTAHFFVPNHPFFDFINKLLSGRLEYGKLALSNYNWTLFGQEVIMNGYGEFDPSKPYSFIDNGYLQIYLKFGVLYLTYLIYLNTNFMSKLYKNQQYFLMILVGLAAIHGFIAPHFFNPIYNPLWVAYFANINQPAVTVKKEVKSSEDILIVGQIKDKGTGLGKALNDIIQYAKDKLGDNVAELDISDNKLFFKSLYTILTSSSKTFYFTPAGSLMGHLRDVCYLLVAKLKGNYIVLHYHNSSFGQMLEKNNWLIPLDRWLFQSVDKIILLGEKQKEMFHHLKLSSDRFIIIRNAISEEMFITEDEFKQKKGNKIIYFSNMLPEKGYQHVVELAKFMQDDNFEFWFSGKFYDTSLKSQFLLTIDKMPKVNFINGVYGKDKAELLKQMDYFILPTEYPDETLPISLLEAMASGLYVLINDRGVISEVLNEQTSTLINHLSIEKIASVIKANKNLEYDKFNIEELKIKFDFENVQASILDVMLEGIKRD
ncbi:glycosyltransferase family 4 protein [Globicatella sanguinis]